MNISENSTVKLGLVLTLVSAIASAFYFVGTAHSKINEIEQRAAFRAVEERDNHRILMGIDRRLSRIEGRLESIGKKVGSSDEP